MNVVQIIPTIKTGGAEKFVIDLCNSLSKHFECTLIVLFKVDHGDFLRLNIANNVKVIFLDYLVNDKINMTISLIKKLKEIKCDVIHTHLSALVYLSLYIPFLNSKIRIFHTIHNLAHTEARGLRQKLYRFLFNTNRVTPISISQEVLVSSKVIYKKSNHILIANGCNKPQLSENYHDVVREVRDLKEQVGAKKVVISIARLDQQKNQLMLLDVIKEHSNVLLLLIGPISVGSNDYAAKVLNEIKKTANAYYLGPKHNVADYMSVSNAIVFSSNYEGLPISLLESMAYGLLCVSTPVGGIPEVIGNFGFISERLSKQSLSTAFSEFENISDDVEKSLNIKIQEQYERFYSIHQCTINHIKHYQLCL